MKKKEKMRKALIKAEHERRDEAKKKYLASLDLKAKEDQERRRQLKKQDIVFKNKAQA